MAGFYKLSHALINSDYWREGREFSRFEAIIWLMVNVAWERKHIVFGRCENIIEQGEIAVSIAYLARQWRWSDKRVRSFLSHLAACGEIQTRPGHHATIIRFGGRETAQETAQETAEEKGKDKPDENQCLRPSTGKEKGKDTAEEREGDTSDILLEYIEYKEYKDNSVYGVSTKTPVGETRKKTTAKINPTFDEVLSEFRATGETGADAMAADMYAYYGAQGWVTSRGRALKNLHLTVLNWIRNERKRNQKNYVGRDALREQERQQRLQGYADLVASRHRDK